MKGMISGIKRMEIHDGDGLRTTVFFKGCPLRCIWCHNPESLSFEKQAAFFKSKCISCGICKNERNEKTAETCPVNAIEVYGREYELEELVEILLQDELFFKNSGGGVTLSGGECLAQPDFAVALSKKLYDRGISVYIDTCGHVKPEALKKIIPMEREQTSDTHGLMQLDRPDYFSSKSTFLLTITLSHFFSPIFFPL